MKCIPCVRGDEKPGRHRRHRCSGGGVVGTIGFVCDCACNRPSAEFVPPVMRL